MTLDPPTLGAMIRARREALGLTRVELGRMAQADASSITRWERGQRTPTRWNRARLADALQLDPDELHRLVPERVTAA